MWPPAEVEMTDDPPELVAKWKAFHECWRIKDAAQAQAGRWPRSTCRKR